MRRDRSRGGLFGTVEADDTSHYDPEKLERQNDADIDHIGERAKHLKEARPLARHALNSSQRLTALAVQVTLNIQGEVESHLRLLDQLARAASAVVHERLCA